MNLDKYTQLLQWHNGVELFDYNQTIDWAIEMLESGIETENILILASFSKPVDRDEIKPYISRVLRDLNLEEKYGQYSIIAHAHYRLELILQEYETRKNLTELYGLYLESKKDFGLMPFYLLYLAWSDLETEGYNYYYEKATLENIELILKKEAKKWIDDYIHGIKPNQEDEENLRFKEKEKTNSRKDSLWEWVKNFWKRR